MNKIKIKIGDEVAFLEKDSDITIIGRVVEYKEKLKVLDGGTILDLEDIIITGVSKNEK